MGKLPQLRSEEAREEKITLQTKIWRKIITEDCNQDDGRVWVSFVCFFSKIVQGQSWHVFKCQICSVIWQTCLLLLPPNDIMWWDLAGLTCFTTAWWVTWQDEEHNMIIRESCLSLFSPRQSRQFHGCGKVLCWQFWEVTCCPLSRHHTHGYTARWSRACRDTARLPHPDGTAASFPRGKATFGAEKTHQASLGI